jgi:opacity protein-like surface antigen
MGRSERNRMGSLMKKLVIVVASTIGVASAAVAADLPVRQPPPPTPVVGKAPIGKGPIGKGPIGKAPIGKGPVVAPPIVTRG